jgi:hypothetical protein
MVERLRTKGNPFANFFQVNNDEALLQILQFLKRKS